MRFSLRALILSVVILGLVVTAGFLAWRNQRLEAENRILREQVGVLDVEDSSRIHVLPVKQFDRSFRRWRVFLPANRKYVLRYANRSIGYHDFPEESIREKPLDGWREQRLPNGHLTVDLGSSSKEDSGLMYHISIDYEKGSSSFGGSLDEETAHRLRISMELQPYTTLSVEGSQRVELLRIKNSDSDRPSAGLLVWIDPVK